MICHCEACNYTFNSFQYPQNCGKEDVPERCPDCGRAYIVSNRPAVRKATLSEVADYNRFQKEVYLQYGTWGGVRVCTQRPVHS